MCRDLKCDRCHGTVPVCTFPVAAVHAILRERRRDPGGPAFGNLQVRVVASATKRFTMDKFYV